MKSQAKNEWDRGVGRRVNVKKILKTPKQRSRLLKQATESVVEVGRDDTIPVRGSGKSYTESIADVLRVQRAEASVIRAALKWVGSDNWDVNERLYKAVVRLEKARKQQKAKRGEKVR